MAVDDFWDEFIDMFEEATGGDGQELKRMMLESERQEAKLSKEIEEYERTTGKPFIVFREEDA
jgi:hypothetical protein